MKAIKVLNIVNYLSDKTDFDDNNDSDLSEKARKWSGNAEFKTIELVPSYTTEVPHDVTSCALRVRHFRIH